MKVICIDNSNPLQPERLFSDDWIFEGEIYTVLFEVEQPWGLFYILSERCTENRTVLYQACRFIPLSEDCDTCSHGEIQFIETFQV